MVGNEQDKKTAEQLRRERGWYGYGDNPFTLVNIRDSFEIPYRECKTAQLKELLRKATTRLSNVEYNYYEYGDEHLSENVAKLREIIDAMKKELSNRPHVPTKEERKEERRKQAEQNKGSGKTKNK